MRFNPRRTFKGTLPFYLISGFFLVLGLLALSGVVSEFNANRSYAWFVTLFAGAMFSAILVKTLAPGSFYEILSDALLIKMGLIKTRISRSKIKNAYVLGEHEVEKVLRDYQSKVYDQTGARDIRGAFKAQFAMGDFIRYCTVPVVFNETKLGGKLIPSDHSTVLRYGADTTGDFALIELENGKKHILSPENPEKFVAQLK